MCCIWENSANSSQQNSLFSPRLASLWPSALIEQAGWHGRIQRRALIKPQSASDSNGLPLDDPHTSGRRPDSNRLFAAGSIQNGPSRGESCACSWTATRSFVFVQWTAFLTWLGRKKNTNSCGQIVNQRMLLVKVSFLHLVPYLSSHPFQSGTHADRNVQQLVQLGATSNRSQLV